MRATISWLGPIIVFLIIIVLPALANLEDGLVLYLPFDAGQGKVASDLSENKSNGSITGAEWVEGKFGKALSFNGKDSFVEAPFSDVFNITEAISLGAWVTANVPFNPQWRGIINARKSTYGPYLLQTGGAAKAEIGLYLSGAWTWLRTSSSLEPKAFHHVVGTYDQKNGLHIYFDGAIDDGEGSAGAKAGPIDETPDEGVVIGHNYNFAGRWWDGIIDEVVIYNRALSEDEVKELFLAPPVSAAVRAMGKLATTWGHLKNY
ncbi:MAG: LamG domain-containing protein [Candidatus Poribacteria bacterium]